VEALLVEVVTWARRVPGMKAVALLGSHARGEPRPDSDVDLLLLTTDPGALLDDLGWTARFGRPRRHAREDWGRAVSVRVDHASGLELELSVARPDWATRPDDGTRRVVTGGLRVLWDPDGILEPLRE